MVREGGREKRRGNREIEIEKNKDRER